MSKLQRLKTQGGATAAESMGKRTKAGTPKSDVGPKLAEIEPRFAGVASAGVMRAIPVRMIVPDPGQPRKNFDPGKLAELGRALREQGQIQPIGVYWADDVGKYAIIFGHRRWLACVEANIPTIDCKVWESKPDPCELRTIQLAENLSRSGLKPMEQARAFESTLAEVGITAKELAARLGVDPAKISRSLALLKTPGIVQSMVDAGDLPPAAAYELTKLKDHDRQAEIAARAVKGNWTRERVIEEVNREKGGAKKRKEAPPAESKPIAPCNSKVERKPIEFRDRKPEPPALRAIAPCNFPPVRFTDEDAGELSPVWYEGTRELNREALRSGIFEGKIRVETEVPTVPEVCVYTPDFGGSMAYGDICEGLTRAVAAFVFAYGALARLANGSTVALKASGTPGRVTARWIDVTVREFATVRVELTNGESFQGDHELHDLDLSPQPLPDESTNP